MEWTLSRSEYETHAKHLDCERNQKHFVQIIDLCKAHLKTLKAAKKSPGKLQSISQQVTLIKSRQGLSTRISVLLNKYTVPMATERKTFACLALGEPFGDVFAVSGYSQGVFSGIDGCLDREEWTAKVFRFSRAIGHVLETWERMDAKRRPLMPGSYYASHAEKQVMAYILWNFTTTYEGGDKGGKNNAEEDERDWRLERLEESKPPMLPTDFDIFVTKEPCDDCKAFQKRVSEVAGTNFNVKVLSPVEG